MYNKMSYNLRLVEYDDYHKGYLNLVNQLFKLNGGISMEFDNFCKNLDTIKLQGGHIYVIEDILNKRIIATGKLIVEVKSHGSKMGIIQDVVTDSEYRGTGHGYQIISELSKVSKEHQCYKVVLNCNPENIGFYKKCGFIQKGVEMCIYNNLH